jgi:hypothetical protein
MGKRNGLLSSRRCMEHRRTGRVHLGSLQSHLRQRKRRLDGRRRLRQLPSLPRRHHPHEADEPSQLSIFHRMASHPAIRVGSLKPERYRLLQAPHRLRYRRRHAAPCHALPLGSSANPRRPGRMAKTATPPAVLPTMSRSSSKLWATESTPGQSLTSRGSSPM